MSKRKKNLNALAQQLETIPEVVGVPEEKFQSVFETEEMPEPEPVAEEEVVEEVVEEVPEPVIEEEPAVVEKPAAVVKPVVKKRKVKKQETTNPISHLHLDSDTSAINLGLNSIL